MPNMLSVRTYLFLTCLVNVFAHCKLPSATMIKVDRPGFYLEYPDNWRIATEDKDHDPDHNFSIEDSEESSLMFIIFDEPMEPRRLVDNTAEALSDKMSGVNIKEFNKYGSYTGVGKTLTGRIAGLRVNTRIFSCLECARGFQVTEFFFETSRRNFTSGAGIVEKTFKIKPNKVSTGKSNNSKKP